MRLSRLLAFGMVLLLISPVAQAKDGWTDLLPNNDLEAKFETTGNWSIDSDGVVTLVPRPGEKGWQRYGAYLWHDKEYRNFTVEFEYQLEPKGNSGFYFHVADLTNPVQHGIEVQIYDSYGQEKLTDHTSGGVIPRVPPSANAAKPAREWNAFSITCKDDQLSVTLNGKLVNEVDLSKDQLGSRPKTGAIGFQDHGLPLKLRKIRIKSLDE